MIILKRQTTVESHQDPRGPWEPITWVMKGKGLIDCCPLWDEDGKIGRASCRERV